MLPHPDDIELDLETGEVIYHGPVSPDDKATWIRLHDHKERHEEGVASLKSRIKSLEARDSDVLEEEEFNESFTVEDFIATLKVELEIERFILITTCLSIMRRWKLPGEKVTKDFVLQRLLDQYRTNGTNPKKPIAFKSKPIDWEKLYKMYG